MPRLQLNKKRRISFSHGKDNKWQSQTHARDSICRIWFPKLFSKPLNFPLCWLAISNHNQLRERLRLQIHSLWRKIRGRKSLVQHAEGNSVGVVNNRSVSDYDWNATSSCFIIFSPSQWSFTAYLFLTQKHEICLPHWSEQLHRGCVIVFFPVMI